MRGLLDFAFALPPHPGPLPRGEGESFSSRPPICNSSLFRERDYVSPSPQGIGPGRGGRRRSSSQRLRSQKMFHAQERFESSGRIMTAGKKIWGIGWRVAVGALLLTWIFHSIFLNEGKLAAQQEPGLSWDSLSKPEQWKIGWTRGPAKLWLTLCLVQPGALFLSVLPMGLTIVLGVWRWRLVLRVQGLELSAGRSLEIS